MSGWTLHRGQAIALPREDIDTDQLIPARFMSTPRAEGYGRYLLHDLRRDARGQPDPEMPINRHTRASVLVARRNFGSGSSREAAVYALIDAGFRAVIAPSFGDIFAGNAVNNGLLPAVVSPEDGERLLAQLGPDAADVTIGLETGEVIMGDLATRFMLDPVWRLKLINGWDDIDLTQDDADAIAAFRDRRRGEAPWAWPAAMSGHE